MTGTDSTKARVPFGSFILTEQATNEFPWATELASRYSARPSEVAGGQNAILTNGETYFPPEAVEDIGVGTLRQMNNKPKEGGHAAIDKILAMTTLQGLKPMNTGGEVMPNYSGGGLTGYQNGGRTVSNVFRGIGADFDRAELDMDDDMYNMRRVLSIPAEQVGEGSGLRYYAGEATSDRLGSLRPQTFMDAAGKMNVSPQDSIPAAMIDEYLAPKKRKGLMGLLGFQDGDMIGPPVPPQMMGEQGNRELSDSIDMRQANPEVYQGGTGLGVVREQAGALQNSIKQNTVDNARKSLQLMRLRQMLQDPEMRQYINPMSLDSVINKPRDLGNVLSPMPYIPR